MLGGIDSSDLYVKLWAAVAAADDDGLPGKSSEGLEDLFAKVAEVIDYILFQGVGGIETVVNT